jgi:hypothetical protein
MVHTVSIWLLVTAFTGAGIFNAIGTSATRQGFIRWGYPSWWCYVTGALEIATAVLIAVPLSRAFGLIVGGLVIASVAATILRQREFSHLAPLGLFAILIVMVPATA